MKKLNILFFFVVSVLGFGQVKFEQKNPLDYDIYTKSQTKTLKPEYNYLSNLNFYGFNYQSFDNLKIRGFLIQPKTPGKYPVIIFNRGGNKSLGAVSLQMMTDFLAKIAEKGYIIMGSQLRGSGQSEGKDEFGGKDVEDVLSLFEIIKTLPNADNSKIGMLGISRGVMTNFLVLSKTDAVKTCVSISGIADLNQNERKDMESLYAELIPNYKQNPAAELQKRSPLLAIPQMKNHNVSQFIIHGQNDERANVDNALKLFTTLNKNKISVRLEIFEDDNHGINGHTNELIANINNWFKERL